MTDVYLTELHRGRQADFFEQFVGRIRYELKIPDAVRRDETRAVVAAFCPTPGPKLVAKAHELANSGDGRLRSLFADLTRARDWAASHSRSDISVDDLKLVAQWRHLGGHWPEEGAV